MKLIDRLLIKAKEIGEYVKYSMFCDDDDDFIKSLGVDSDRYLVDKENNLFDFMAALNDTAKVDWADNAV